MRIRDKVFTKIKKLYTLNGMHNSGDFSMKFINKTHDTTPLISEGKGQCLCDKTMFNLKIPV